MINGNNLCNYENIITLMFLKIQICSKNVKPQAGSVYIFRKIITSRIGERGDYMMSRNGVMGVSVISANFFLNRSKANMAKC